MKKSIKQIAVILIGLVSLGLGILAMSRTQTVILSPWFLVLLFVPVVIIVSFLLGLLAKAIFKIDASRLTYTSIFVTLFSLAFYLSEHKPNYEISVPENFTGEVKLFLSKEDKDDFLLNRFGVGYISKTTYYKGFKPTVFQNGQDITDRLRDFSEGSVSFGSVDGRNVGPYKYLSFTISENVQDTLWTDLKKILKFKALDTTRIQRAY